jgi:hypothetical protein
MTNDLERRLEALSRRLNADRPAGTLPDAFQAVVIFGGLPPGEPLFAVAGEHEWLREWPVESLDPFADRAVAGARELKESLLVIGGLPTSQAQQDVAQAAHAAWLLTDDGVPPCEPSRGVPSPVQRAIDR